MIGKISSLYSDAMTTLTLKTLLICVSCTDELLESYLYWGDLRTLSEQYFLLFHI